MTIQAVGCNQRAGGMGLKLGHYPGPRGIVFRNTEISLRVLQIPGFPGTLDLPGSLGIWVPGYPVTSKPASSPRTRGARVGIPTVVSIEERVF